MDSVAARVPLPGLHLEHSRQTWPGDYSRLAQVTATSYLLLPTDPSRSASEDSVSTLPKSQRECHGTVYSPEDTGSTVSAYSELFIRLSISLCIIAAILVVNRFYQMSKRKGTLTCEDIMSGVAMVLLIVMTTVGCQAFRNGMGYHQVADTSNNGCDLTSAYLYYLIFQALYIIVVGANKLTFLALYVKLFPRTSVQPISWVLIAAIFTGTLAFVFAKLFQCQPADTYYEVARQGHCVDLKAYRWSWAVYNLLSYVLICMLPLPTIMRVQLPMRKRFGACALLTFGFALVTTSSLRNEVLSIRHAARVDVTWQEAPAAIWSQVEAASGVVAGCLPSLWIVILRLLPARMFDAAEMSDGAETTRPPQSSGGPRHHYKDGKQSERGRFHETSRSPTGISVQHEISIQSSPKSSLPPPLEDYFRHHYGWSEFAVV